jgi:NTE family protein
MTDPTNTTEERGQPRIALALSGGGFRASIFHLGVLRRLAEAGLLGSVDVISTVSGGSIIGAYAALRWQQVMADGGDWQALERNIVTPFLDRITTSNFVLEWLKHLPKALLSPRPEASFSRTAVAADLYDEWFFQGATLDQLPASPRLVLNATSLPSIRAWRFTREGMGDSRYGYTRWATGSTAGRISLAVSASAAFPPVFTPVRIRLDQYTFSPPPYGETRPEVTTEMPLSDGGVYDNLGLEVLLGHKPLPTGIILPPPDILVASDAGHPARYRFAGSRLPFLGAFTLLGRVRDIALEQVSALRRRSLVESFLQRNGRLRGILPSIKSSTGALLEPDRSAYLTAVGTGTQLPPILLPMIQTIRTSLDRFSTIETEALMYHAYTMTDAFWWAYLTSPRPTPDPSWKITFDDQRTIEWAKALTHSGEQLRLR